MIFKRRPPADPIGAFWQWWVAARPRAETAIAGGTWSDDLVDELTERVRAIHPDLEWEFGPGRRARHALVVTATGDRTLRALAERWRRAGPAADDTFEFAAARQADLAAVDATLMLDGRKVALAELRFAVEVDSDAAQAHVRVWHPAFADLPEEARWRVAFLTLDWLLGEDGVEIWVGEVDTATGPGPALTPTELAAAIADLAAAHREPRWAVLGGARAGRPVTATIQVPLRPARWPLYDTHVRVTVPYRGRGEDGFPTDGSLAALRDLEDRILAYVDGAALVAHETSAGARTYHLYADGPVPAEAVRPIVEAWPEGRVTLAVNADPKWDGIRHLRP